MVDPELYGLADALGQELKQRGMMMATAESCTGGWIAQAVTMVPGSSDWFERGFVTYTYISKREMLGVSGDTLGREGAVSEQVVREMADGAIARSRAQVAVAVSGIAGPGGGTLEKPVGTVCFAWRIREGAGEVATHNFPGDRDAVRRQAVVCALEGALRLLGARKA